MLLRAGDQQQAQTGAADPAKWQSFSIRSVLGDALHDDDDDDVDDVEEDLEVLVDADGRPERPTTSCGEEGSWSGGAGSSDGSGSEDVTSREDRQKDDVQRTADSSSSSSLCRTDDISRWTAFHATPSVIISSSQHPTVLSSRYSNHGTVCTHRCPYNVNVPIFRRNILVGLL